MFNTMELEDRSLKPVFQFFQSKDDSSEPSVFNLEQSFHYVPRSQRPSTAYTDDIISIMERMDDNKFFNLDQFKMSGTQVSQYSGAASVASPEEELTAENISRYLCKHKNCPAAQKFKELGIGPLAAGKGLGTIYDIPDPPVTYGLSHATGTMEHYGPYGFYRKPKRIDQPFEGKKSDPPNDDVKKTESICSKSHKSSTCSCQKVLRLSGGGPMDDKVAKMSPLIACKGLMDDFDKVGVIYLFRNKTLL